jgi:hypothetical protein
VPRSFRTDGQWIWSDALHYYLREHALAPTAESYSHVVHCGYRCPEPERAAIRRAVQMLIGS